MKCQFWVKKKSRYCPLEPKQGYPYCGLHMPTLNGEEKKQCPYNKGHSIPVSKYQKHLETCTFKPILPKCYSKDVNVGSESKPIQIELNQDNFSAFYQKINRLWNTLQMKIESRILDHPVMKERLLESHDGKHSLQQASLIGHIQSCGFLDTQHTMIEFGAGAGEMSKYLHKASPNHHYILIDREKVKMRISKELKRDSYELLIIDIKDLDLNLLTQDDIVGYSKHLCGCATDLTLRCALNYQKCKGLVIALCCHGKVTFGSYINHGFLEECEIDEEQFHFLRQCSTWGVSGMERTQEHWSGLQKEEMQRFGLRCKRILDHGRVLALRNQGYDAHLYYYCSQDTSLENVVLVCQKKDLTPS
ncbi:methyltransferase TRM13-domain-containing protein [Gorgonomyces haynaldii]|nr:methyltransferase TRM13-domain-containing protein [Gorgonomyces haynaldii]